ncbi:MAG: hypothetical protein OEM52_05650 [bacterium]|nr:hypothetical protein [bacterium]
MDFDAKKLSSYVYAPDIYGILIPGMLFVIIVTFLFSPELFFSTDLSITHLLMFIIVSYVSGYIFDVLSVISLSLINQRHTKKMSKILEDKVLIGKYSDEFNEYNDRNKIEFEREEYESYLIERLLKEKLNELSSFPQIRLNLYCTAIAVVHAIKHCGWKGLRGEKLHLEDTVIIQGLIGHYLNENAEKQLLQIEKFTSKFMLCYNLSFSFFIASILFVFRWDNLLMSKTLKVMIISAFVMISVLFMFRAYLLNHVNATELMLAFIYSVSKEKKE